MIFKSNLRVSLLVEINEGSNGYLNLKNNPVHYNQVENSGINLIIF